MFEFVFVCVMCVCVCVCVWTHASGARQSILLEIYSLSFILPVFKKAH